MSRFENQTLALAGMFQAAALIDELATSGECESSAFDCSFASLFTFDAETTFDVFGDVSGLSHGFAMVTGYLGGEQRGTGGNIAYYVLSMLKIAPRLLREQAMASHLHQELQNIEVRARQFDMSRDNMIKKIDVLYQDTISQINPRIMVRGDQNYLLNAGNAGRIRTLLLAGIRAGVLWLQLGGSKWKLMLLRKKYVATARRLRQLH